jgi:IS6 family transposase
MISAGGRVDGRGGCGDGVEGRLYVDRQASVAVPASHGFSHSRATADARAETAPLRARVISAGHAFIQNLHRGHYELGVEKLTTLRVAVAFTELTVAI